MNTKLHLFTSSTNDKLIRESHVNLDYYFKDEPFVYEKSAIDRDKINELFNFELITPAEKNTYDFENSKIIYDNLKFITPLTANHEPLWSTLTHTVGWNYMQSRWPIDENHDEDKQINNILSHYFFRGPHPKTRNGLARLWWFAYVSFDSSLDDPYKYTYQLINIGGQDLARLIIESNTISRNKYILQSILDKMTEIKERTPSFNIRDLTRYVARSLNLVGSITVLDFLNREECYNLIESMVDNYLQQINYFTFS